MDGSLSVVTIPMATVANTSGFCDNCGLWENISSNCSLVRMLPAANAAFKVLSLIKKFLTAWSASAMIRLLPLASSTLKTLKTKSYVSLFTLLVLKHNNNYESCSWIGRVRWSTWLVLPLYSLFILRLLFISRPFLPPSFFLPISFFFILFYYVVVFFVNDAIHLFRDHSFFLLNIRSLSIEIYAILFCWTICILLW